MSQVKDPAKEFEALLQQRLRDTPFDVKDQCLFSEIVGCIAQHLPLSAIGCNWPTLKEIIEMGNGKSEPTLYHVSFVFNGMERISPSLAKLNAQDHMNMMDYVYHRGSEWNKLVDPIKNSIMRKMQSDADLKGRIVKPNGGLIGVKN